MPRFAVESSAAARSARRSATVAWRRGTGGRPASPRVARPRAAGAIRTSLPRPVSIEIYRERQEKFAVAPHRPNLPSTSIHVTTPLDTYSGFPSPSRPKARPADPRRRMLAAAHFSSSSRGCACREEMLEPRATALHGVGMASHPHGRLVHTMVSGGRGEGQRRPSPSCTRWRRRSPRRRPRSRLQRRRRRRHEWRPRRSSHGRGRRRPRRARLR